LFTICSLFFHFSQTLSTSQDRFRVTDGFRGGMESSRAGLRGVGVGGFRGEFTEKANAEHAFSTQDHDHSGPDQRAALPLD
jgi:hypothetical protein